MKEWYETFINTSKIESYNLWHDLKWIYRIYHSLFEFKVDALEFFSWFTWNHFIDYSSPIPPLFISDSSVPAQQRNTRWKLNIHNIFVRSYYRKGYPKSWKIYWVYISIGKMEIFFIFPLEDQDFNFTISKVIAWGSFMWKSLTAASQ